MPHFRKYPDVVVGSKYGRLTVLTPAPHKYHGKYFHRYWIVRCSCGCLKKEVGVQARVWATRHGEGVNGKETPEYVSWIGMMKRCYSPSLHNFRYWGGRGIKVCERWKKYENFLADMGRKPTLKHSIDRIDNDGDYTPENCRWATATEQQNNKRPKGSVSKAA